MENTIGEEKLNLRFRGAQDRENPGLLHPECGTSGEVWSPPPPAVLRNQNGHDVHITETGVQLIEELAANGNSYASMAKALGVGVRTFHDIRKRQADVVEAIEIGYSAMEDELVDILMKRARDASHKGGVTAAIFLLKARRGYEGVKTPTHLTINDNRQQVLALPSAKDVEAYVASYATPIKEIIDA